MTSSWSRAILIATFTSIIFVACSKEEAAPVEAPAAAPAPTTAPAAEDTSSGPGGYEPTAEERVPGITEPAAAN